AVKKGGDRQEIHEQIRVHSMEAGSQVKLNGSRNDLLDRIAGDSLMNMSREEIAGILNVDEFIGRAPEQTREFIEAVIDPLISRAAKYGTVHAATLSV
ncbi:MAG: hypothetical protein MUF22_08900, partial [Chitinispirillaceae bacterium]|nr:hypothetical protein [Chitinispirillaceae bacterium]